jgi:hypothetical protein
MKKVYQTIVDENMGNCMQAAIASLFNKNLEDVPNFIEFRDGWFKSMYEFLNKNGYDYHGHLYNRNYVSLWHTNKDCFEKPKWNRRTVISPKKLYKEEGVQGLFYAAVLSPKYFSWSSRKDTTHAVLIDRDYSVVFDPNPEYMNIYQYPLANLLGYNGIVDVMLINPKK